jgi:heat shock protein HtpX
MSTRIRTWILLAGLSALLVSVGALIGGASGLVFFLVLAIGMNLAMYWWSDKLALKMSRARPLGDDELPTVHEDVRALSEVAGLPMPRLYLIPSEQPNAFATGRSPRRAAVAVTEGLVRSLPRDEVRAVLAHELAHVKNRDILVASIAAMIGAAISAVAHFLQFQWLFGGDDESPMGIVGTIAAIILAPLAAMVLQLAVSRQREYLADETAARWLGEGRPLASALSSLERGVQAVPMEVNPATASLYIASPLSARGGMSSLFSTHPPIPVRIERLRTQDARKGIHWVL